VKFSVSNFSEPFKGGSREGATNFCLGSTKIRGVCVAAGPPTDLTKSLVLHEPSTSATATGRC